MTYLTVAFTDETPGRSTRIPKTERPTAVRDHYPASRKNDILARRQNQLQEDYVRKAIILAIGAMAFLAGCGNQANKTATAPAEPKWKGAPYRISLDTKAAKPSPSGVTIPTVKWTANPDALEKRACLVVQFDLSKDKDSPAMSQMILGPVDISGAEGALPPDYMELADKQLAQYLAAYKVKGKFKISVALARSSLNGRAGTAEVDSKRLSDWLETEVNVKGGH